MQVYFQEPQPPAPAPPASGFLMPGFLMTAPGPITTGVVAAFRWIVQRRNLLGQLRARGISP